MFFCCLPPCFLLEQASQGWCPPIPVFQRMGTRTNNEIQQERHALKALRRDYHDMPEMADHTPDVKVPQQATKAFEATGAKSND